MLKELHGKEKILFEMEQAIQDMVLNHPLSVEEICRAAFGIDSETGKMNKPHWTLFRELNPNDGAAKLGYITLLILMDHLNDDRPLELMAEYRGKFLLNERPVPDKGSSREEAADDLQAVAEMQAAMAAKADPGAVQTLAAKACDDILQTAIKYAEEVKVQ